MKTQTRQTREGLAPSPFVAALRLAILKTVREMRANGDTGASVECLRQMVPAPSHLLDGAPLGTNAVYFYGEIFRAEALNVAESFILAHHAENYAMARSGYAAAQGGAS